MRIQHSIQNFVSPVSSEEVPHQSVSKYSRSKLLDSVLLTYNYTKNNSNLPGRLLKPFQDLAKVVLLSKCTIPLL